MKGRGPLAAALGVAVLMMVGVLVLQRQAPLATPASPSPTSTAAATPTAPASPTEAAASPSPVSTATPTATAAASGRFVNAEMGYSIELTPPWHWSDCGSGTFADGSDVIASDLFFAVSDYDVTWGHTGTAHDHIAVSARTNPQGLTPREWYEAVMMDQSIADRLSDVTFAGRPALRVAAGDAETYAFAQDGRMFQVSGQPSVNNESTPEQRAAVIATFRLLTPEEVAAARAVPTPTPPATRSAERVADVLAEGFAKKDVAILATVITTSCMSLGVNQGGGSAIDDRRYLDELAQQFRDGLVVEVRPRPITDAPNDPGTLVIGALWKEPRNPDVEVDLRLSAEGDRWYWRGVLFYPGGRR